MKNFKEYNSSAEFENGKKLARRGMSDLEIDRLITNCLKVSPGCFGGAHLDDASKELKAEIIRFRGNFLASKLKAWLVLHPIPPQSLYDLHLDLDRSDPALGSSSDADGHEYILRQEGHLTLTAVDPEPALVASPVACIHAPLSDQAPLSSDHARG